MTLWGVKHFKTVEETPIPNNDRESDTTLEQKIYFVPEFQGKSHGGWGGAVDNEEESQERSLQPISMNSSEPRIIQNILQVVDTEAPP